MARRADVFLRPHPGSDLVWLSAVSKFILDEGLANQAFLDEWVVGLDDYRDSLTPFTLAAAERATGLSVATLQDVARRIAAADGVCILWAMGVTQHTMASDTSTAISNLLLLTGNYRRPGAGAYPLRGHNNVQGASDMGSMPGPAPRLPGRRTSPRSAPSSRPPGASRCRARRGSTTTRWSTPSTPATSRRCTSTARR